MKNKMDSQALLTKIAFQETLNICHSSVYATFLWVMFEDMTIYR